MKIFTKIFLITSGVIVLFATSTSVENLINNYGLFLRQFPYHISTSWIMWPGVFSIIFILGLTLNILLFKKQKYNFSVLLSLLLSLLSIWYIFVFSLQFMFF